MLKFTFYKTLDALEKPQPGQRHIIAITEEFTPDLENIRSVFTECDYLGMVVPHFIVDNTLVSEGIGIFSFPESSSYLRLLALDAPLETIQAAIPEQEVSSFLLFADGLSAHLDPFVDTLDVAVGDSVVLGSGVGVKGLSPSPVIFDKDTFASDMAILAGTGLELQIVVEHGWQSLYGPVVVTDCDKNVIKEINGQPAFEVYKKVLFEAEGKELTSENFNEISPSYPFGISSFVSSEFIIRDPIFLAEDGSITTVSSVAKMDSLYIMIGKKEDLIESADKLGREVSTSSTSSTLFLFDCISRVFFLGDDFTRELKAIHQATGNGRIVGLASVGEISNAGFDKIKVFNKTTLLGAVQDG